MNAVSIVRIFRGPPIPDLRLRSVRDNGLSRFGKASPLAQSSSGLTRGSIPFRCPTQG
ncbi:hypothetical protein GCM10009077_19190 [Roseibium denhamense]